MGENTNLWQQLCFQISANLWKCVWFDLCAYEEKTCLWFVSDGVGEHQQSGMCCQEVLQHGRVRQHLEGGNAAGLQLLDKVKFVNMLIQFFTKSLKMQLKTVTSSETHRMLK